MAFVYNKTSKLTMRCDNEDALTTLKKDDRYIIADSEAAIKKALKGEDVKKEDTPKEEKVDFDKMKTSELRSLAKEKGIENTDTLTKAELISLLK